MSFCIIKGYLFEFATLNNKPIMKCIFVIILITCFSVLKSQVPVQINLFDQKKNKIEHIIRSLEGPGVEILNITSNQKQFTNQLCSFYDSTNSLGMAKGIILSTGSVRNILGKNSYTGMTGLTEQPPKTIMDTIQQYVPCIIKGKKPVLINNVQKIESFEIEDQYILMYKNSPIKDSIINYKIEEDYITSKKYINQDSIKEDVQMCMQTYIIPKYSNFTYNISNDPDLLKEVKGSTNFFDACIVEMDIVPKSDFLSFRYLFGSEEYDEYVCSPFNDAFAFFLSGPGINGKQNLATIKNDGRITINSVNKGNPNNKKCKNSNPSFYNKNNGQLPLEYDGFTRTMAINQKVKRGEIYHLKIIIADASDGIYDSGVFIENNSMITYSKMVVIPFKSGSIKSNSLALDKLVPILKELKLNKLSKVEISGHTDSIGLEIDNLKLSQKRIENIVKYFMSNGVRLSQLIKVNKGEHMPVASNSEAEGRENNRRVEVKFIP